MRRIRFRDGAGTTRSGTLADGEIHATGRTYDPEAVTIRPPVEPSKIVCVGWNYRDHVEEKDAEVPDRPELFVKPPNAVSAPRSTVTLPPGKEPIEFEAELGVVVGEQCRHVDAADADSVVAGYTCVNDLSNREDQWAEQNWFRGKAFDNSAPIGPVVADPEDVPDDARIRSRLNGEVRQDSSIDQFIWSVGELIAEITALVTLEPGDVIATGTPHGVGELADGDHVEIEIEGIGVLENTVRVND
jgi:2-keto-4-pentenoate hydratase/2-oxohepta-3-ene-1,7-dioic acid hydratase in catechol pathway